jgi:hypothetical protein
MNWLDAIFIVFLILGAVRGLLTGKLLPLLIVFAIWITSIAIAVNFEVSLGDIFGVANPSGEYHWPHLLAFFIILVVIQVIIYWSAIPIMVLRSIDWRPERRIEMLGGLFISACIAAIYCGLVWRILTVIADAVVDSPSYDLTGSGFANSFVDLIQGSATRSGFVGLIDWFEPPKGIILGCVMGAALVALAVSARLRQEKIEESENYDAPPEYVNDDDAGGPTKTEGL